MNIPSFSELQYNLYEIYAALINRQKDGVELPLYATSSGVYYTGCLTGRLVKEWNGLYSTIYPYGKYLFDHATPPSFKMSILVYQVVQEHVFDAFDQQKKQHIYQMQLRNSPPSLSKTLEFILTTLFHQAVEQAYNARQRRIWHYMSQLDQCWNHQNEPEDAQRNRYEQFLAKEFKTIAHFELTHFDQRTGYPLQEAEQKAIRHTIVNFHQATYVFWRLFLKEKDHESHFRQCLMEYVTIPPTALLNDRVLFKSLKREGRWAQFEGVTQQAIPVVLLSKIHELESMKVAEKNRLQAWVKAINQNQKNLSLRMFVTILEEVVQVIQLQGFSPVSLQDLICWLDQQGCMLIQQDDDSHLDWRERLKLGDEISCNGKVLILGRQLSPNRADDTFKIFELRDQPQQVVKIANNRFRLLIESKQAQDEHSHWGVRFVETIENLNEDSEEFVSGLDRDGRCIVLEKLTPAFETHEWSSQTYQLIEADEKLALVFANHIFCMIQRKASAQNLSLNHLMWDNQGVLKSTRILKKGPPNYNKWEGYIEQAAKGNFYVLNFLMHVSKLNEHPIATYYRHAVEHVLETGETDLINRSLPLGHRQECYDAQVKLLCAKAQELRQTCLKQLIAHYRNKEHYHYKKKDDLEQIVVERLLLFYRASPLSGRFFEGFEHEVVNSLIQSSLSHPVFSNSSAARQYHQEQHTRMMRFNRVLLPSK